jgi:hypothetical protein
MEKEEHHSNRSQCHNLCQTWTNLVRRSVAEAQQQGGPVLPLVPITIVRMNYQQPTLTLYRISTPYAQYLTT